MTAKKKVQYKYYAEYLKSDKWKQVKKDYRAYAEAQNLGVGACFFCKSDQNIQHHHWRYEKDWNDDSCFNLLQACRSCHVKLNNSLNHISTTYKTKEEYLSDATSVLIAASHLEGFAEGEGIQEKERTDESNAFIDHSNEDIDYMKELKREHTILSDMLYEILAAEGVQFQYTSYPQGIRQRSNSSIDYVELSFSDVKCIYNRSIFDRVTNTLFDTSKDEF